MERLRWMCCGLVLACAACVGGPVEQEQTQATSQEVSESSSAAPARASFSGAAEAETCTETLSACRTGRCELGPNDTFQTITEVCCTPSGGCTTERYKLCGC